MAESSITPSLILKRKCKSPNFSLLNYLKKKKDFLSVTIPVTINVIQILNQG